MRVLLIDWFGGDGMLDFAMRCSLAGHEVKWHFKKQERTKNIGRGLVEIINDWREWMRWADIVILADNTKYLREIDAWRKNRGVPVIGATTDAAAWELDRSLGQRILKKAKIPIIPYKEFANYDDAINYVKRENRRFVSKPIGDEPDKALSYVAKSGADMVYMLQRWKRASKLKGHFMLQEFVKGTEMAVGGWFGPGGFLMGWCENFEFKQLMAGDRGPNTGEMGTVLRYTRKSKLAAKVLAPLEDELYRIGYQGYVDVNCIIDEKGDPWPLEFTMRMGWPTFNIQQSLHDGDPVAWLVCLSEGRDARPFRLNEMAVGVVMALPDFPYSHVTMKEVTGVPVYGLTPARMDNIHPCQLMQGYAPQEVNGKITEAAPCLVTAGDYVLIASGTGASIRKARASAYRLLDKIETPSSPFWRPDIGTRLKKQLPLIQTQGYATGIEF